MDSKLLNWLVECEDIIVPTLFKPAQFQVLKNLKKGVCLSETEKRYLRGAIKKKFFVLGEIKKIYSPKDDLTSFLNQVESYYVTGLQALKYNGYGWYFEPKIIEVINTRIEGTVRLGNKLVRFFRIKSLKKCKYFVDESTGIKYASNEQIIKDVKFTDNFYVENVWNQMYYRYGRIFAKNKVKIKEKEIDYSKYGV